MLVSPWSVEPPSAAPAPVGFALTVVEGSAVLALETPLVSAVGTVLSLALEVPDLRFPFDLSGGVARFRHRRCRLRELTFRLEARKLAGWLGEVPLADFGIFEPALSFQERTVCFSARAAVGGHSAEVTLRAEILVGPGSSLGLSFDDVRVYGFLPIPGPLLVEALYRAFCRALPWLRLDPALLEPMGATAVRVDLLQALLVGLLPARSWRVPVRQGMALVSCQAVDGDLLLRFARPERDAEAKPPPDPWLGARAAWEKYAVAEASLASGDLAGARALYRRALSRAPQPLVFARLVQLMVASQEGLGEVAEVVARAQKQLPDWEPGRLALALAAEAGGRFAEAALGFASLAARAAEGKALADEVAALLAAARCWGRAGDAERAIQALLSALERAPDHPGAIRALRERLLAQDQEERWDQILAFLRQRSAEAFKPETRAALLADTGTVLLERGGDPERARQCFEQAVRLFAGEAQAWEGLGRVELGAGQNRPAAEAFERARSIHAKGGLSKGQARAELWLGRLAEASGDLEGALLRFARAMDLDGASSEACFSAGDVAGRLGRLEEAMGAFKQVVAQAASVDERVQALRRLAAVERDGHGDTVAARLLLEQALSEKPEDFGALEDLERLLSAGGQLEELAWPLRRARSRASDAAAQARLAQLFCRVGRATGDTALLEEGLWWLAELRSEEGRGALLELAALVEDTADESQQARLAELLEAFWHADADSDSDSVDGALACRLAALRAKLGDVAGAEDLAHQALAGPLEGAPAKEAWDLLARLALLRDDPAAAAAAYVAGAEDSRVSDEPVARAGRLVAAGQLTTEELRDPGEAVSLFERALSLDPENQPAHLGLGEALLRLGRWQAAAGILEAARGLSEPPDPAVLAGLAEAYVLGLDRVGEGESVLQALAQAPVEARLSLAQGRIAWKLGRLEESARHFEQVVAAAESGSVPEPFVAEARLRLAQWFRLIGESADARRTLTKALSPEPEEGAPSEVLAEVLETFNRVADLVDLLERRREIWAGTAEGRRLARTLGQVLERQGRGEEAVALYAEVLAASPGEVDILTQMAEIYRRESRSEPLAEVLGKLFDLSLAGTAGDAVPTPAAAAGLDPEALGLELSAVLDELGGEVPAGQSPAAEDVLRRLLAARPACGEALEALSEICWQTGRLAEADDLLKARLGLGQADDASSVARLVARRALAHLDGEGGEETAARLLAELGPTDEPAEVVFVRAELAARRGQPEVAFADFSAAARAAPEAADVAVGARAQERLTELARTRAVPAAEAIAALQEVLEREPRARGVADALFELYEQEPDEGARLDSFRRLLGRAGALDEAAKSRIHQAFAHAAEAESDFVTAEREFGLALGSARDPSLRAAQLLGRARVRIRCGDFAGAVGDLDGAAALSPDSADTAKLRAELEDQRPRSD